MSHVFLLAERRDVESEKHRLTEQVRTLFPHLLTMLHPFFHVDAV